jgi:hypothetical protein
MRCGCDSSCTLIIFIDVGGCSAAEVVAEDDGYSKYKVNNFRFSQQRV